MARLLFLVILPLITIAIVSCNVLPGLVTEPDRSFLTDQPCAAPCWYGLEPGKSTKEEVHTTLRQLPFIEVSSIKEFPPTQQGTIIISDCRNPKISHCVDISIEDEVVRQIGLAVGYDLTLEAVVQRLGEPKYVRFSGIVGTGGTRVNLYWPEKRIVVDHQDKRSALFQSLADGKPMPRGLLAHYITYATPEYVNPIPLSRVSWPGFEQ